MTDIIEFRVAGRAAATIHLEEEQDELCVHLLEIVTQKTPGTSMLVRCDKDTARAIRRRCDQAYHTKALHPRRRAEVRVVNQLIEYLLRGGRP